jgi:hypothetical protein
MIIFWDMLEGQRRTFIKMSIRIAGLQVKN